MASWKKRFDAFKFGIMIYPTELGTWSFGCRERREDMTFYVEEIYPVIATTLKENYNGWNTPEEAIDAAVKVLTKAKFI